MTYIIESRIISLYCSKY